MEAVELPPVGMSWARAGLPALGPPPLKKGRSRQELMQREAEFQRRRGAAPARGRRQALDPLAGSRRRPDAQERPPAMGLDGFERPEETGPGGVEHTTFPSATCHASTIYWPTRHFKASRRVNPVPVKVTSVPPLSLPDEGSMASSINGCL